MSDPTKTRRYRYIEIRHVSASPSGKTLDWHPDTEA